MERWITDRWGLVKSDTRLKWVASEPDSVNRGCIIGVAKRNAEKQFEVSGNTQVLPDDAGKHPQYAFAAPDSPAYRVSKAAINMYAAVLAERHISVTPMHPGWVQTRMGGESAPFTVEQSAAGLFRGIEARPASGKFWNIETDSLVA